GLECLPQGCREVEQRCVGRLGTGRREAAAGWPRSGVVERDRWVAAAGWLLAGCGPRFGGQLVWLTHPGFARTEHAVLVFSQRHADLAIGVGREPRCTARRAKTAARDRKRRAHAQTGKSLNRVLHVPM